MVGLGRPFGCLREFVSRHPNLLSSFAFPEVYGSFMEAYRTLLVSAFTMLGQSGANVFRGCPGRAALQNAGGLVGSPLECMTVRARRSPLAKFQPPIQLSVH